MTSKTINVFGCGGAGSKIVNRIAAEQVNRDVAEITPIYFDASRSDSGDIALDETAEIHYLPNKDGSGSVRRENHADIVAHLNEVLPRIDHTPLSIIVFSAAGGTGNVYATEIASYLAKEGHPFLLMFTTDDGNKQWAENSLKTLMTIAGKSRVCGRPFPFIIMDGETESGENALFVESANMVRLLAASIWRSNSRIDSADLKNFFQFTNVLSDMPMEPVELRIEMANKKASKDMAGLIESISDDAKATATVALRKDPDLNVRIASLYGCSGILPESSKDDLVTYTLSYASNRELKEHLTEKVADYDKYQKTLQSNHSIVGDAALEEDGNFF